MRWNANNHTVVRGVAWLCASSSAPARAGGYPGRAVPGRGNPRAGSLFRLFPITGPWGGIPTRGGADEEGAKSPLPCLWFQYAGIPHPSRPRPPPPPRGRGQSWRYPRKAVSGRVNPRASSFFRLFPIRWTVGGIARGWGRRGGGKKPPPLSLHSMGYPAGAIPGEPYPGE
jgi:hypothetical protein